MDEPNNPDLRVIALFNEVSNVVFVHLMQKNAFQHVCLQRRLQM